MCFTTESSPPVPPVHGAAVDTTDLTLTSEDGTTFTAFAATGVGDRSQAGIVILPDVRGLYRFYEELAVRFAERGYDAVAIDYFGRTAGLGKRDDDFDFWPHVRQTTFDGVRADVAAAVAQLRSMDPDRPVFTMGFCFGGSNSWHQAANGHGLAGVIGFYGHPNRADNPLGADPVVERVDDMACPVLGLLGGADDGIPGSEVDAFATAMDAGGVSNELITYPGAPHSFFDRLESDYAAESADAWERSLRFIEANS